MGAFALLYLKRFGSWLIGLPLYVWVILALSVALWVSDARRQEAQDLADARQATIVAMENAAKDVPEQAQKIVEVEVVKYRDRIQYIKSEAHVIEKQVPIYIPADTPALPGGFRLLHDAAAQGRAIADNASGHDAAPVPVETAALTIAENYSSCLQDKERLAFFQSAWKQLEERYGTIAVD